MPEDSPRERAIDRFNRAIGDPAWEGDPEADPRKAWYLPRIRIGSKKGESVGKISDAELNRVQDAIWGDHTLRGFEEMHAMRVALNRRERLAQEIAGNEGAKSVLEHKAAHMTKHARIIIGNRHLLKQYRELTEAMGHLDITVPVHARTDENLIAHVGKLDEVLRQRVALAQYMMLLQKQEDRGDVPQALLEEARDGIPDIVQGTSGTAQIDREALRRMTPKQASSDPNIRKCMEILDRELEWILSFQQGVPGVSAEVLGKNPVHVFYQEYLSEALKAVSAREVELGKEPGSKKSAIEALHALRDRLQGVFQEYKQWAGKQNIAALEGYDTGFFDEEFADESQFAPADLREFIPDIPRYQEDAERYVAMVIGAFRTHKRDVLGGTDAEGRTVKGVFETSILDFRDWQLYKEDVYKEHARFKMVYPILDLTARIGALPAVVGSRVNPLEKDKTFREEADRAMRHVRKGWNLPENIRIDGKDVPFSLYEPKHWDALSPEQWTAIQESMRSTKDVLEERRDDIQNRLNRFDGDLRSLEELRRVQTPDDLIGVLPDEATFAALEEGRTSIQELLRDPELGNQRARVQAAYFFLFVQMHDHWQEYAGAAGAVDADLFQVAERGIAAGRGIREGGREVGSWWLYAFGALGLWYLSAIPRSKRPRFIRALGRMGKDVAWVGKQASRPFRGGKPRGGPPGAPPEGAPVKPTPKPPEPRGSSPELPKPQGPEAPRSPLTPRQAEVVAMEEKITQSRAGKFVERLKLLRESRAVRTGGRIVRFGGVTLPAAAAAYEIYENQKRIRAAAKNPELQAAYRWHDVAASMEAAGMTLGFVIEFLPRVNSPVGLFAVGTLWPAREYDRARAEVHEGWIRRSEDWLREKDSPALRQELLVRAPGKETRDGGGSLFRSRVDPRGGAEDQKEAYALASHAERIARENIYEAYFYECLPIPLWAPSRVPPPEEGKTAPQGATRQEVTDRMVRNAVRYIGIVTGQTYAPVFSYVLEQAQTYALLMERHRALEEAGQPTLLHYHDAEGKEQWLDLDLLPHMNPGTGKGNTREETHRAVLRYEEFVEPEEHLTMFQAFGLLAEDQRVENPQARAWVQGIIRQTLFDKVKPDIHAAEMRIRRADFPGLEILGQEADAANMARLLLLKRLDAALRAQSDALLGGTLSPEEYKKLVHELRAILEKDPLDLHREAMKDGLSTAERARAQDHSGVPSQSLLLEALRMPGG